MECSHKTYNIYCDESTHLENDGQPYMIYGYVSIPYNEMVLAKKQIREIKQKHGYEGELKWTNISDKTFALYNEIVDYFFMTNMKFRAVIVDDCLALYRVRQAVERCRGSVRRLGSGGAAKKEEGGKE